MAIGGQDGSRAEQWGIVSDAQAFGEQPCKVLPRASSIISSLFVSGTLSLGAVSMNGEQPKKQWRPRRQRYGRKLRREYRADTAWFPGEISPSFRSLRRPLTLRQRLCSTCRSLQLSVHRFKVQSLAPGQRPGAISTDRMLRSSSTSTELGTLAAIKTNSSSCPSCALIFEPVVEFWEQTQHTADENEKQKLLQSSCVVTWEIDGRDGARSNRSGSSSNMVRGLTRRMHVRVSDVQKIVS